MSNPTSEGRDRIRVGEALLESFTLLGTHATEHSDETQCAGPRSKAVAPAWHRAGQGILTGTYRYLQAWCRVGQGVSSVWGSVCVGG